LFLFARHAVLNAYDGVKSTPLHWAVAIDNDSAVKSLLRHGADTGREDKSGYPALHSAVKANSLKCLQAMIDFKVWMFSLNHY